MDRSQTNIMRANPEPPPKRIKKSTQRSRRISLALQLIMIEQINPLPNCMRKVYTPAPKKKQKNLHYSAPISSPAMFPRYRSLIGGKIAGTHVCTKTREKTINYAVFDNVLSINKSIKRLFCLFMKVGMAKWAYNFHTHDCSHV